MCVDRIRVDITTIVCDIKSLELLQKLLHNLSHPKDHLVYGVT